MRNKARQRCTAVLLSAALFLTGCAPPAQTGVKKQYQATFLNLFDTVTMIIGYADSEESFRAEAQKLHDALLEYHQLFDIYTEYPGISNLKTVNDRAGKEPVKVDARIIALLEDCKSFCDATGGRVNAAMGSVLLLWHDAREAGINDPQNAALPGEQALQAAAAHMSFDTVRIDTENSTVFLEDPAQRLDVGAVAKGWAVQRVAESAPAGMLISVGGNVCATGEKPDSDGRWVIGVQSPEEQEEYLHTLYITEGCVVTSGDYQRSYTVDGKAYHHIIDPETLYPGTRWRAVTVLCADSGVADALSTALFLLPQAEGQQLLEKYGAEAMWVSGDGTLLYSPGFKAYIRT